MIFIREIIEEDAEEITQLSHQLGYSITNQQTLGNINAINQSQHHAGFVAIEEKKVIGWIGVSYSFSLQSPPLCEIRGLVVHEHYRGKGTGKMLIQKARTWSTDKNVNKLSLRCNAKRAEAARFYQHIGFTLVKDQRVFEMDI